MKYTRWRYQTLGGIPVKKGNFLDNLPSPRTPTEKRCEEEIIKLLIKK